MAITQGQPRATKVNILTRGCPTTDVYKMALYTNTSTLAPTSAVYQLSACNVKAVLVGGDAEAVAEVRLVSVV